VAAEFRDFFAYLPDHKYLHAPTRALWPASSVNARLPEVDKAPASVFLDRERPIEQLLWHPGEPQLVHGKYAIEGGWEHRGGARAFNLYRPPPLHQSGDPRQAEPWLRHVRRIYPDDAEHILRYLAFKVQRPGEKVNHAVVLGGGQGIGKDTLLEPARYALGAWNVAEVSPVAVLKRFNPWVKCVLAVINEARDLGEADRYAFYEHMKVYLAAPPHVLECDEKYMRQQRVFNVMGVVITTNHKTGGMHLPADDRRHYVAWSEATKEGFDDAYWRGLWDWYSVGGLAHCAAYLRALDLSDFAPKAPPRRTEAWHAIVAADTPSEEMELADVLDDLGRPVVVTGDDIRARAESLGMESLAEQLRGPRNARRIPHQMERVGYVAIHNEAAADRKFKVAGRRRPVYGLRGFGRSEHLSAIEMLPNLSPTA
jgi:hypothetical protein